MFPYQVGKITKHLLTHRLLGVEGMERGGGGAEKKKLKNKHFAVGGIVSWWDTQ